MIVVKIGGSEGIDLEKVADDAAELIAAGEKMVIVHGGSHLTNQVAKALGHPPEFITSPSGYTSRRTDRRTLEIFEMVYCGQVNKGFVELLQKRGVNAVGLSGIDGKLWEGTRKAAIRSVENGKVRIIRDDFTGKVTKLMDFGAFVEISTGVEGLVHISELSWKRVERTSDAVQPGKMVKVKILKVEADSRKISLSIKQTTERPVMKGAGGGRGRGGKGGDRVEDTRKAEEILKETPKLRRMREQAKQKQKSSGSSGSGLGSNAGLGVGLGDLGKLLDN